MIRIMHHKHTVRASSIGYIVQSLINTFAPLLFVTFQTTYDVTLSQISFLIALNFGAQIALDIVATAVADKVGYRRCVVFAHICAAVGIAGLGVFPELFGNPFLGLAVAVMIYGAGGGLTEVLLTPIVEACPIERKDKAVSMLHAFYCWGGVMVIVLSAVFFKFAGIDNWKLLALLWTILPIANAIYFAFVPMYELVAKEERMPIQKLFGSGMFWLLFVFMFCAGSSEMAIAQWASHFAEEGLKVTKTVGDLLGPCLFAALKGLERTWYGKFGNQAKLWQFMLGCAIVCAACYVVIGISGSAIIALIAIGIAGFTNGVMWPGTFSTASKVMPTGGTAMFGLLALAGDLGCGAGPAITGAISTVFGDDLKVGFLFSTAFAGIMVVGLIGLKLHQRKKERVKVL